MASPQELFEQLQNIDFQELDVNNIGSWPPMVKAIILVMGFSLALGGGYFAYVSGLLQDLDRYSRQEESLKQEYEDKGVREFDVTGGKKVEVVIDRTITKRLSECASNIDNHRRWANRFRIEADAYGTQPPGREYDLDPEDVVYFRLAGGARGD